MEDIHLAKKVSEGDREADEQLVQMLYRPIFLAMRHLTRSWEDAEDLTQQTFIQIKQNIRQFRGKSSLKTWAMQIGFREYLRIRKSRRVFEEREEPYHDQSFDDVETAAWLLDLLRDLPDKQRDTFVLLEVENLSVGEVATIMGVPKGTVKTRNFHARRAMKYKIEQEKRHQAILWKTQLAR